MDLHDALVTLQQPAWVDCRSDASVVDAIEAVPDYLPPTKTLVGVPALDGDRRVRPIDVFRGLAYATRIHYAHPDVYGLYSTWAWIRYLGLFGHGTYGRLVLSPEARRVRGNQRGVASEELGIGFAKIIGEEWMIDALGPGAVTFVDVDVVQDGGTVPFVGGRHTVARVHTKRPDYFMIHTNPKSGSSQVRVLESKGTSNFSNQARQLASAVHQLEGVEIDGVAPTGLAVSAAFADVGTVRVLSVDPPDNAANESVYQVRPSVELVDGVRGARDRTRPTNGVFEASWAQLADYAGASQVAVGWATDHMRQRLSSRPDEDVVTLETSVGICVGRRAVVQGSGNAVRLFAGIPQELHTALESLDRDRVLSTQADFVSTYGSRKEAADRNEDGRATSVGVDGTVLDIRIEG